MPEKPGDMHAISMGGSFGMSKLSMRTYLSSHYLWSAEHHRDEVKKIEDAHSGDAKFDIKHRAYVLSAIISAVSFSESFINEVLQDIADGHLQEYPPVPERSTQYLKKMWDSIEESPALSKFQTATFLFEKEPFDIGMAPMQDYKLVLELRNFLIHYKPKTVDSENEYSLTKKLKNKFESNKMMVGVGNPFLPDKALGAGCAEWAVYSTRKMCDEFCARIGLSPNYQKVKFG